MHQLPFEFTPKIFFFASLTPSGITSSGVKKSINSTSVKQTPTCVKLSAEKKSQTKTKWKKQHT